MAVVPQNEGFLAADYARILKFSGDAAGRVSGAQHYECLARRFDGRKQGPGEPSDGTDERDECEPDQLSHSKHSVDEVGSVPVLTMVMLLLGLTPRTLGWSKVKDHPLAPQAPRTLPKVSQSGF